MIFRTLFIVNGNYLFTFIALPPFFTIRTVQHLLYDLCAMFEKCSKCRILPMWDLLKS